MFLLYRCVTCPAMQYCLEGSQSPSGACPEGYDCTAGVLRLPPGHWAPVPSPASSSHALNVSPPVKCFTENGCRGWTLSRLSDSSRRNPAPCADGYDGVACSHCDVGWVRFGGTRCVPCPPVPLSALGFLILTLASFLTLSALVAILTQDKVGKSQVSL